MTLESRIAALAALSAEGKAAFADKAAAESELRQAIVDAVRPVLPALCNGIDGERRWFYLRMPPRDLRMYEDGYAPGATSIELASGLADAIDRQLGGSLPLRIQETRARAVLLRALAGALRGMDAAKAPKGAR